MSETKRVRIVSDGTRAGSRVYNHDGTEVSMVRAVSWSFDVAEGEPATAHIEVILPQVELTGEATVTARCPYCGREGVDE